MYVHISTLQLNYIHVHVYNIIITPMYVDYACIENYAVINYT